MAAKLWTSHYVRICTANLLLFASLYSLFPVLPIEMAKRFDMTVQQTGSMFLPFILGLIVIGPFHAYIVDAYKRKTVYMLFSSIVLFATAGYALIANRNEAFLLMALQGVAFGMATSSGITLSIDMTGTSLREKGNVNGFRMIRLGGVLGVVAGSVLYAYSSTALFVASGVMGLAGILIVSGLYVPFRAPIVTQYCSFDRFILLRAWILALNVLLIAFVPGMLIPLVHSFLKNEIAFQGITIPFFAFIGAGGLLSLLLTRFSFLREQNTRRIVLGIFLQCSGFALWAVHQTAAMVGALLIGCGLGIAMPEFLRMFVRVSNHCERGTANTMHLLACEIGICLGMMASYRLDTSAIATTGVIVTISSLLFYLLLARPFYNRKRVR